MSATTDLPTTALPSTPKRADLVKRFFELRPQMERRFTDDVSKELHDELGNVTLHQLSVLRELRHGPVSMRELAKTVGVSESAATATADRLVRQGLAERQSDPTDRRVVRLAQSERGARITEAAERQANRKTKAILSVLSDEQLSQLIDIFETLVNNAHTDGQGATR